MANANNVSVGKPKVGGAIYVAPVGTTLPTDAVSALDEAFVNLGYISEDGINNDQSHETGVIKAWGGDVVDTYESGFADTVKTTLTEALNVDVLKTIYGDSNVSGTLETGISVKIKAGLTEPRAYVVEILLKGGGLKRIVVPDATITALDTITYKSDTPIGYGITLSTTPDEDGDYHREHIIRN